MRQSGACLCEEFVKSPIDSAKHVREEVHLLVRVSRWPAQAHHNLLKASSWACTGKVQSCPGAYAILNAMCAAALQNGPQVRMATYACSGGAHRSEFAQHIVRTFRLEWHCMTQWVQKSNWDVA